MTPEIIYEDIHIIAVNKPWGYAVLQDKTGDTPLLEIVRAFLYERDGGEMPYLEGTHRIDRPASGVVLFAKSKEGLSGMNKLFQDHKDLRKTYWAVTTSRPAEDTGNLVHYLKKRGDINRSKAYDKKIKSAKKAELNYKVLASSDRYHLLEIELLTGRHHQIRAQLGAIKCVIRGDVKYGFKRALPHRGILLHARSLAFKHPITGDSLILQADPPKEPLWDYFRESLGK